MKKQRDGLDITAKPPSTWADIVESLIGAVYLDANCDMTKLKRVRLSKLKLIHIYRFMDSVK